MRRFLTLVLMAVRAVMQGVAAVLDRIVSLVGGSRPPMPMPPAAMSPDEVREEYADAYEREAAADAAVASDLGHAVHRYARADDPGIRCAVDLGGLNPAQMDWLLNLKNEDLKRLAQAGPRACELAVSGRRSGIVGLPVPTAAASQVEGPHPVRDFLVDRVRTSRTRSAELLA